MPLEYIVLGYVGVAILLTLIGVLVVDWWLRSLPETTTGYIERTDDEIIVAWEKMLKGSSDPDKKYISCGSRLFSEREFVEAMKNGDEEVRDFGIECPRILARELETDPVEDILGSRP